MEIHHQKLVKWIEEMQNLCNPSSIHICDGTEEEYEALCALLVAQNTFIPLKKRPGSYYCRSHPDDVARVEESTFICSAQEKDAGPTNHWEDPEKMRARLLSLFKNCMRGRTLYVVPFCMGPLGSKMSQIGVQITDSPYVVVNTRIMTRMGQKAIDQLKDGFFVPCMHSVGVPIGFSEADVPWPCNPENRVIVHFPESREIWSYGSGYGGNALLGKKCFALRIASVMARDQMWMAEHMLIMGVTSPEGKKKYFTAAFPSACGKTNLAMLKPSLPDWKVECVGDDIAWMKIGEDGRLFAINPEAGMFGVAPGTSWDSNPSAMEAIKKNTIFTNVALTDDGDVWWEGMTETPPKGLTDWKGGRWTLDLGTTASHPNARFTAPLSQCPVVDPSWDDPTGVPISAIIFGGRRSEVTPLVLEARSWQHGVFMGATVSSEMTAAAKGKVGTLRHDPFAMLPFCGYHMGDYFAHWIAMGHQTDPHLLPKIFQVNWFLKDKERRFLWPGFGENIRVLAWIFSRVEDRAEKKQTPIGIIPNEGSLQMEKRLFKELFTIDPMTYTKEMEEAQNYLFLFGEKLPKELIIELEQIQNALNA